MEGTTHKLTVPEGEGGRLDSFIAEQLTLSRTRAQKLVASGMVLLNGRAAKKSEPVSAGAVVEVQVPPAESVEIEAEDLPLDIVFEDSALLVVNKAAGMVVHPAPGHRSGTMVNALMHHVRDLSGVGGRLRPGIVHRLDRHTSGLLVVHSSDSTGSGAMVTPVRGLVSRRAAVPPAPAWAGPRKMTEWPYKRGPLTKIKPSDGCKGDTVPLAVDQWYDFHELGCHLGNVG